MFRIRTKEAHSRSRPAIGELPILKPAPGLAPRSSFIAAALPLVHPTSKPDPNAATSVHRHHGRRQLATSLSERSQNGHRQINHLRRHFQSVPATSRLRPIGNFKLAVYDGQAPPCSGTRARFAALRTNTQTPSAAKKRLTGNGRRFVPLPPPSHTDWFGSLLFVMCPHPKNLHRFLLTIHLINKPVLNINPSRIRTV